MSNNRTIINNRRTRKNTSNKRTYKRSKANQNIINSVSLAKSQQILNKDLNALINYYINFITTNIPTLRAYSKKEELLNKIQEKYNELINRIYTENKGNTLTQVKVMENLENLRVLILVEKLKLLPDASNIAFYKKTSTTVPPPPPMHPSLLVPYGHKVKKYNKQTSLSNFVKELTYILNVNKKSKLVILPGNIWSNIGITISKNIKRNKTCINKLIREFSNISSDCYKSFPISNDMDNDVKKNAITNLLNVFNRDVCVGDPRGGGLGELNQQLEYYEKNKTINISNLPSVPTGKLPTIKTKTKTIKQPLLAPPISV